MWFEEKRERVEKENSSGVNFYKSQEGAERVCVVAQTASGLEKLQEEVSLRWSRRP